MIPTRILGFAVSPRSRPRPRRRAAAAATRRTPSRPCRTSPRATNDSDGDKFCDLVTTEFLEQTTGAKGDKAKDACKKQIDSLKNPDLKVDKISKTEVNGDNATVTAVLVSSGQKRPQVFNLKKQDGEFKLASAKE